MQHTISRLPAAVRDFTQCTVAITATSLTVDGTGWATDLRNRPVPLQLPVVFSFPAHVAPPVAQPLRDGNVYWPPIVWEVTTLPDGTVHLIDSRDTRDLVTGKKLRAIAALGHLFFPNGLTPTAFTDATVFHQYAFGPWDETVHGPKRRVACHGHGGRDWYLLDGTPCDEQGVPLEEN